MVLTLVSENKSFNGKQKVIKHYSEICKCDMTFGLFIPKEIDINRIPVIWFLSGLTCTHENAMVKAGAQQWAAAKQVALIFPDTSPRGKTIPDDESFDLGQGAGFYLDAQIDPWVENFKMESYILEELCEVLFSNFNFDMKKQGIMGHSMGGLGAINLALKNPTVFKSVSAFAPIANPSDSEWGQKQFRAYLGPNEKIWQNYDPSILIKKMHKHQKILIDQGTADTFINLLRPESLSTLFESDSSLGKFRYHDGYDHSYFFVSTFIKDHIFHHAEHLN